MKSLLISIFVGTFLATSKVISSFTVSLLALLAVMVTEPALKKLTSPVSETVAVVALLVLYTNVLSAFSPVVVNFVLI